MHSDPSQYNQQPGATQPMQSSGARNAKNLPLVDGQREWSNGVFDCFADPLTCKFSSTASGVVSWFLPCVSYGRNRARYQALENSSVSKDPMEGVVSNETIMYGAAQFCGCGGLIGMGGRQLTRSRYSIQGDGATDCLLSCFCAPCALTQESRELELEEQSLGHAGAGFSMFMPPQGGAVKVCIMPGVDHVRISHK
ncbi:PLAC8-domain-containing protein [Mycena belliarum]|uniref:PLAC8-domain-containing protein n=1 Tax=Mycena belliarum TaxID=1033014 RepID=A0AAD6U9C7_9AGAR|nr:PLAC8-domain-containing protein [Mycena belliae]